jgi:hypothetical protein
MLDPVDPRSNLLFQGILFASTGPENLSCGGKELWCAHDERKFSRPFFDESMGF